jgi:hypothetical protein
MQSKDYYTMRCVNKWTKSHANSFVFIMPTSQENLAMNNGVIFKHPSPCAFHINNDIKYVGISINQLWKHFFLEEIFNNELHFISFEQNMK